MQINKRIKFNIDFSSRKYRMITMELFLVIAIITLSQIIATFFPMEEPLRDFGNDYWLCMLLVLVEVILIGLMFFVIGIWYSEWRYDKDVRLIKDLAMEDISSNQK